MDTASINLWLDSVKQARAALRDMINFENYALIHADTLLEASSAELTRAIAHQSAALALLRHLRAEEMTHARA